MKAEDKLKHLISEFYNAEKTMEACMKAVKDEFQKHSNFEIDIDTYSGDGLGLSDLEEGDKPSSVLSCVKAIAKNGILKREDLTENF